MKYRFSNNEIKTLLKINWWDKDFDWLKDNFNSFSNKEMFSRYMIKNILNKKLIYI